MYKKQGGNQTARNKSNGQWVDDHWFLSASKFSSREIAFELPIEIVPRYVFVCMAGFLGADSLCFRIEIE